MDSVIFYRPPPLRAPVLSSNRQCCLSEPQVAVVDPASQRPIIPAERNEWDDIMEAHDEVKSMDMTTPGLKEQRLHRHQASGDAESGGQGMSRYRRRHDCN